MTARALAALALLVASTGCGAAARPEPALAAPIGRATFETSRWSRTKVPRFELSFALPDAAAWTLDDRGPFFVASHEPSASKLLVRVAAGTALVTQSTCEAQASRLAADWPKLAPATLVDDRRVRLDGRVDARLRVAAGPDAAHPGAVSGAVVVVAADVRKCWVLAYATVASGEGADALVADRLVSASEGLVPSLRLEGSFDVPRERAR